MQPPQPNSTPETRSANDTPELVFDQGTLLLSNVGERFVELVFPMGMWIYDPRVGKFRTDALHYQPVSQILSSQLSGTWSDRVPQWKPVEGLARLADLKPATQAAASQLGLDANPGAPHRAPVILRPDQQAALQAWLTTRRGCLVMPTGTGKTEVALHLMATIGASTLIVAPVRDLMYQWHRRILQRTGIDAGILGDGIARVSPLTVTTYDSAYLHMARIGNQFALVVFDECHHLPGVSRQDAARNCAAPYRLGLTATIERSDGREKELEGLIGPILYRQHLNDARGTTLADYDVYRIPVHLSEQERKRYDELSEFIRRFMYEKRQSDPRFNWPKLCAESASEPAARRAIRAFHAKSAIEDRAQEKLRILEDLFRLHAGEPCLIFTGTNAMARDISRKFLIPCLLSHCGKRERLDILSGLEEGRYPAIVANRVLDEGVDLPDVKVAIVIGGSASPRQATQRLGRILRRSRFGRGVLYEIVTQKTRDVVRARRRRKGQQSPVQQSPVQQSTGNQLAGESLLKLPAEFET